MATRAPLHAAGSPKPRDEYAHRSSVFIQAHLFLGLTIGALTIWRWPMRWLLSGAPGLTYVLWLGEATGYRILPFVPLWTVASIINLTYSVATTSWLLFGIYLPFCYTAILLSCLWQFEMISNFART